jgi:hypothetical protein
VVVFRRVLVLVLKLARAPLGTRLALRHSLQSLA